MFKESEDGGAPPYVHDIETAKTQGDVKLLNTESLEYFQQKQGNGEDVQILEITQEELFQADPVPEKIFTEKELEANRQEAGLSIKDIRKKREKNAKSKRDDGNGETAIFELLAGNPYSEGQLEEIRSCIADGIPYGAVVEIADIRNTAGQMKRLREGYGKKVGDMQE